MARTNLNFKQTPVLLTGVVVLATAWIGLMLILPSGLQRLRAAKMILAEEQQKSQILGQLEAEQARVQPWQRRLSAGPNAEWLITETARLAREAGIRVTSMEPRTPIRFEGGSKLSVALSAECSYHELGQFLSFVESSMQLMMVEQVHITPAASDESTTHVDLVLSSWQVAPMIGGT